MNKALRSLVIAFYICCAGHLALAQQSISKTPGAEVSKYQDSLMAISKRILASEENTVRFAHNATFIKTLVQALKLPGAYESNFDSLEMVSTIKSPDDAFRIYTWYVPTDEGSYRYFGAIQLQPKGGQLQLFPLIDDTQNFLDSNAVSDHKKWFGSRYYEIVPFNAGKEQFYALLGWKGNDQKTTSKVIEILSFKAGQPVLGKKIFDGPGDLGARNRLIFTYNKANSMTLRFDKKVNMIVSDHLAPYDPDMVGNYEFYASDSSFDGYTLNKGKLKLVENIKVNNDSDAQDELYIDPSRKDIPIRKKF